MTDGSPLRAVVTDGSQLRGAEVRALTLHRPWTWAFTDADKRVENRSWPAPLWLVNGWLALHAGLRFDVEAARAMREGLYGDRAMACPMDPRKHPQGIVAFGRLQRCSAAGAIQMPWGVGPYLWHVPELHVLQEPIPCRGRQGLWAPPPAAVEAMAAELQRTTP